MVTEDQFFGSFAKRSLLLIGDFMVDRTVYGEANRISPEAPTPVVSVNGTREQLGGAGNVARNLSSLGGRFSCAAVVGDDAPGYWVEEQLRSLPSCQSVFVMRETDRKTTVKTRIVAVQPGRINSPETGKAHQQMLRLDEETRTLIRPETAKLILDFASQAIDEAAAVLLSDYAKGTLPPFLVEQLIELARKKSKPIIIDPKSRDFSRYQRASVLTPNAAEAEAALGISLMPTGNPLSSEAEKIVWQQIKNLQLDALLITLGAQGLALFESSRCHYVPTAAREVLDVTGAGDTFIASFTLAISAGASYAEAARLANVAAGVAVGKAGAAAVYPYEIQREMDQRRTVGGGKIHTIDELTSIIERIRSEGKRVVFTSGSFDLLHSGHVHLLNEAKKSGDILVVGVNSDELVQSLKGAGRPIVVAEEREYAVAALQAVDYVTTLRDGDLINVLTRIRPDTLVKGSGSEVAHPELSLVSGYGGGVHFVPLRGEFSTTNLLYRIRVATV